MSEHSSAGSRSLAVQFAMMFTAGSDRPSEGISTSRTSVRSIITRGRISLPIGHFIHCVESGYGSWEFDAANYRAALDAAMTLCLHIGCPWRGASERGSLGHIRVMIQTGQNNPTKARNRRESGGLTVIELFPLFIAVSVFLASAAILTKYYGDSGIVWIVSAVLGAGSWVLYAVIVLRFRRKL